MPNRTSLHHCKLLYLCVLLFASFVSSQPAPPLTDLVYVRQLLKNNKLQICVAHTGHGQVYLQPPGVGVQNLSYVQMKEFPHLSKGLLTNCFWINHSSVSFKIIGVDLMGQNRVGPWVYVEVRNNKIKQWTEHNNQIYKDRVFSDELL